MGVRPKNLFESTTRQQTGFIQFHCMVVAWMMGHITSSTSEKCQTPTCPHKYVQFGCIEEKAPTATEKLGYFLGTGDVNIPG
jgi:hypothetical protein